MNTFLKAVRKHDTYTENGAISNSTTGNALLDYFSKAGTYLKRSKKEVAADISRIWAESPYIATQLIMYFRLITRSPQGFFQSQTVQKGQGLRNEYRKAIMYIAEYNPEMFYKNMWLMPVIGCWKDLWHEDLIDCLREDCVYELVQRGLGDKYNRELLAKYLPKIRSRRNVFNDRHRKLNKFARGLCSKLGWTEKQYRKFKSSGRAHEFQKQMCNNLWNNLDFGKISGKALFTLVNHKGKDDKTTIERHGIESAYLAWLDTQPTVKFTGYVYELLSAYTPHISRAQKHTLDKQFEGLLEIARKDTGGIKGNVWCALDTSGSMSVAIEGSKVKAIDVCVGLGIYFAELNTGAFKNQVIMFDNVSRNLKLSGSFTDKINQIQTSQVGWGGTNFQSVVDEIARVRRSNPNIPIEDYPETLLVVSDMQFNPASRTETNYEVAMSKLSAVGLPNIRIIWWQVNARRSDVPATMEDNGTILVSGFDGSIATTLLGGEQTITEEATGTERTRIRKLNPFEVMLKALDQEVLKLISI